MLYEWCILLHVCKIYAVVNKNNLWWLTSWNVLQIQSNPVNMHTAGLGGGGGVGHRKCLYQRGVIYKERWSILSSVKKWMMWSTCHEPWDKEKNLSPRTPVECSKHWAMRDWRTCGVLGHIKGPCMTCILRTARVSNVEIIMSRGVLIKRVEFRENVRARDVKNCP